MKPTIGFIGIGIMGFHMSRNLLEAGYCVEAYDLQEGALNRIVDLGAKRGGSIREVASCSDVVITMLPDSPDVEKAALGVEGILEGARDGLIYIDMSTIAPYASVHVSEQMGLKGVRCLDAPVSGGEVGAQKAALSIMVGGPEDLFKEVLPIFEVMGKTITLCGPSGAGQIVKACNQVQVALNFVGMAEALVLGSKAGIDPAIIIKVLSGGYAQTRVMDVRGPQIIKGNFAPGFKSKFHYKDLNIIMDTARRLNVPLPATAIAHELFSSLLACGGGDLDHSAVIQVIEAIAGVRARTGSIDSDNSA
jgi:2-hydroxy-3-oxopropionate reductase